MVASKEALGRIKQTISDALQKQIKTGWPANSAALPDELQQFVPYADELVISGGFIHKGQRIYVPVGARQWATERLHRSHIGLNHESFGANSYILARNDS
jgi:hypothetical protein